MERGRVEDRPGDPPFGERRIARGVRRGCGSRMVPDAPSSAGSPSASRPGAPGTRAADAGRPSALHSMRELHAQNATCSSSGGFRRPPVSDSRQRRVSNPPDRGGSTPSFVSTIRRRRVPGSSTGEQARPPPDRPAARPAGVAPIARPDRWAASRAARAGGTAARGARPVRAPGRTDAHEPPWSAGESPGARRAGMTCRIDVGRTDGPRPAGSPRPSRRR
jgi:hypothetical protein